MLVAYRLLQFSQADVRAENHAIYELLTYRPYDEGAAWN